MSECFGLRMQLLDPHRRAGVCEPSTHRYAPARHSQRESRARDDPEGVRFAAAALEEAMRHRFSFVSGGTRRRCRVVHRRRLLLEPRELPLDVGHEQVGEIVREAAAHDDAERREVRAVLRERVCRNLPAAFAQGVRDVEDGEVVDVVLHGEREHRKLVPSRHELERPELRDARREPRGDLACVRLHLPVALEPEAEEVVVLRDHLRSGPGEIERERRHVVAQVVDPEDQVLRQRRPRRARRSSRRRDRRGRTCDPRC